MNPSDLKAVQCGRCVRVAGSSISSRALPSGSTSMAILIGAPPIDAVIYLDVNHDESVRRLIGRAGQEGRTDDEEQTIRHRLDVFETLTKQLVNYYADRGLLIRIDGEQPIDNVTEEILKQLATRT